MAISGNLLWRGWSRQQRRMRTGLQSEWSDGKAEGKVREWSRQRGKVGETDKVRYGGGQMGAIESTNHNLVRK